MKIIHSRTASTKKAFTLMELMIVISIITLMASFAIPTYSKSIRKAKAREILLSLRQLNAAVQSYRAQHSDFDLLTMDDLDSIDKINQRFKTNIVPSSEVQYMYWRTSKDGRGWMQIRHFKGCYNPGANPADGTCRQKGTPGTGDEELEFRVYPYRPIDLNKQVKPWDIDKPNPCCSPITGATSRDGCIMLYRCGGSYWHTEELGGG